MSAQLQDRLDMRRGGCPGALTPMQTGDGWLLRVRPRNGAYTFAQLRAIAQVAHRHGNGEIDLTSRANLQIRGLSAAAIPEAQTLLADANLIDETPAHEAARNILIAPFAGIDPTVSDVRPLALALEQALLAEPKLQTLPSKFNFVVDGGGSFALAPGLADISLRSTLDHVDIELAGAADGLVARVAPPHTIAATVALVLGFVEARHCDPAIRRMRDLVQVAGCKAVFARAGLESLARSPLPVPALPIGLLGPENVPIALGIGLPFGRISAPALFQLIVALRHSDITEVRPAPGRILVLPLYEGHVAALKAVVASLNLITSGADPRLAMDVCPGAPACERGSTHTRKDGEHLASVLPPNCGPIHISGCAKGCARQSSAALTFVARDGRYDLVMNGTVTDAPTLTGISSDRMAAAAIELTGEARG